MGNSRLTLSISFATSGRFQAASRVESLDLPRPTVACTLPVEVIKSRSLPREFSVRACTISTTRGHLCGDCFWLQSPLLP